MIENVSIIISEHDNHIEQYLSKYIEYADDQSACSVFPEIKKTKFMHEYTHMLVSNNQIFERLKNMIETFSNHNKNNIIVITKHIYVYIYFVLLQQANRLQNKLDNITNNTDDICASFPAFVRINPEGINAYVLNENNEPEITEYYLSDGIPRISDNVFINTDIKKYSHDIINSFFDIEEKYEDQLEK